jgi:hypothetical protein
MCLLPNDLAAGNQAFLPMHVLVAAIFWDYVSHGAPPPEPGRPSRANLCRICIGN